MDHYDWLSPREVTAEVQSQLQPGVTTREDVLLLLGEPDSVSIDDQRFGYTWRKVTLTGKEYRLYISFDASNRVSRADLEVWDLKIPFWGEPQFRRVQ